MNDYNTEVWKDVIGFEGKYEVSNFGRIRNSKTGRIRKLKTSKGYKMVTLGTGKDRKTVSVHREVARTFISNPDDHPEVNHIDENKVNNHESNLMWCTSKENSNWGKRNDKISELPRNTRRRKVAALNISDGRTLYEFRSISEANKVLGVHKSHISNVCKGRAKTAGGFKWKYIS